MVVFKRTNVCICENVEFTKLMLDVCKMRCRVFKLLLVFFEKKNVLNKEVLKDSNCCLLSYFEKSSLEILSLLRGERQFIHRSTFRKDCLINFIK